MTNKHQTIQSFKLPIIELRSIDTGRLNWWVILSMDNLNLFQPHAPTKNSSLHISLSSLSTSSLLWLFSTIVNKFPNHRHMLHVTANAPLCVIFSADYIFLCNICTRWKFPLEGRTRNSSTIKRVRVPRSFAPFHEFFSINKCGLPHCAKNKTLL